MKNLTNKTFHSKDNQARIKLGLRLLVALYLLYLTKGIIEAAMKGASSMPTWIMVLVSIVFISSSVAFCIYAWLQYKHSLIDMAKEDDKMSEKKSEDDNS